MTYFWVFLLSNLLEVPVYWGFLKGRGYGFSRTLALVTTMNSLTHPIVFFLIMNFKMTYLANILIAEAFAITAEAWMLKRIIGGGLAWMTSASIMANLTSWQLAPVITGLLFL